MTVKCFVHPVFHMESVEENVEGGIRALTGLQCVPTKNMGLLLTGAARKLSKIFHNAVGRPESK